MLHTPLHFPITKVKFDDTIQYKLVCYMLLLYSNMVLNQVKMCNCFAYSSLFIHPHVCPVRLELGIYVLEHHSLHHLNNWFICYFEKHNWIFFWHVSIAAYWIHCLLWVPSLLMQVLEIWKLIHICFGVLPFWFLSSY